MRSLRKLGAGAMLLLGAAGVPAWSNPPGVQVESAPQELPCPRGVPTPCPAPCASNVVTAPPLKIRLEMSPPEVIVQTTAAPPCPEKHGLFHRCSHKVRHAPVAPLAPVYQPVYQQPVYQQPIYQQPVYQQPIYQQPVYQQPVVYAPAAPVTYAPAAPVSYAPAAPQAPVTVGICPQVPAAPQAPQAPQAPAAPGTSELNEVLRKLTNSVDLLTKMVNQHTKVLEYHDDRIEDLSTRVNNLTKRMDSHTHPVPEKRNVPTEAPEKKTGPGTGTTGMLRYEPSLEAPPRVNDAVALPRRLATGS